MWKLNLLQKRYSPKVAECNPDYPYEISKMINYWIQIWEKNIKNPPKIIVDPIYDPLRFWTLPLLNLDDALISCKKFEKLIDCLWDI